MKPRCDLIKGHNYCCSDFVPMWMQMDLSFTQSIEHFNAISIIVQHIAKLLAVLMNTCFGPIIQFVMMMGVQKWLPW